MDLTAAACGLTAEWIALMHESKPIRARCSWKDEQSELLCMKEAGSGMLLVTERPHHRMLVIDVANKVAPVDKGSGVLRKLSWSR